MTAKYKCRLGDLHSVIQPQVDVKMIVCSAHSGKVLWEGPAHYFTGNSDLATWMVKELRIKDGNYYVNISK